MNAIPGATRRARLLEYVPWLMRDYAVNQGPSTGIVVFLIGFMTVSPLLHGMTGQPIAMGHVPAGLAAPLLRAIVEPLVFLGAFFATNGIIANDRKMGYYRFLFAKPVSPVRYYAITFATYGAGLVVVTLALMGIWAAAVRPMFPVELLGVVLLMYLAFGGLGFLLSAAWRFDWLSLVTVVVAAKVLWAMYGDADGLRHWLLYLLPPVHRATDVYALVANEGATQLPWIAIGWLSGYGLVCLALGMVVIRRRPLGTS